MLAISKAIKKVFGFGSAKETPVSVSKNSTLTTVGLYYPGTRTVMIRNPDKDGISTVYTVDFPGTMLRPVSGQWDKNMPATVALFDLERSIFFFRHKGSDGAPDGWIPYGDPSQYSVPLAGDWDGDGVSGIGIFNSAKRTFHLKNMPESGLADHIFSFGRANQGLIPIAGDWDGDGKDSIGLYDPVSAEFMLKNSLSGGVSDIKFALKDKPSIGLPLAGDWLGRGKSSVGIYDLADGSFKLIDDLDNPDKMTQFSFGPSGQKCIPFSIKWQS